MDNLTKAKRQYTDLLIIELAERYRISYKEAKVAISVSAIRSKMDCMDYSGIIRLWKSNMSNIIDEIWAEYSNQICIA